MFSYAVTSSAPVLTGNDSGFYHLIGWAAIILGVICLAILYLVLKPATRRNRDRWWIRRDPFEDNWKRQQSAFLTEVMEAEPDTVTDTIAPGAERVPLPPNTGRPPLAAIQAYSVVVNELPPADSFEDTRVWDASDLVLEGIRRGNEEFLARLDSI